jgi:transcriptional regulator with XRE-family HTH domain
MYLNGNRMKETARLRRMTREQLQKKSGISDENFAYYWDNPVTAPSQEDVEALAKALGISADLLLVQGQPKVVALRDDKFSTE